VSGSSQHTTPYHTAQKKARWRGGEAIQPSKSGVAATQLSAGAEFRDASYAKRYEILLTKLLRERLYDGASLLLTSKSKGRKGEFHCPCEEFRFQKFAASLSAHAIAFARSK